MWVIGAWHNFWHKLCEFVQDPVPVVGKFGSVYARPGHRVLIDPKGNMIVRPTPLDLKLAQACKFCDSQPHPATHGILHQLLS